MKKKKLNILLYALLAASVVATPLLVSVGQASWITVITDSNWSIGERYVYNVKFDYLEGEDKTFVGLERSAKLDLPEFNDDRYESTWKIGSHSYSGTVSVNTLFNDSGSLTPEIRDNIKVYTITLAEEKLGLKDGFVEIYIEHAYNMSNGNTEISSFNTYSLVTKLEEKFLVFNINPEISGYTLDHFVYGDGVNQVIYNLNDALYLSSGGVDESKIINRQLILSAYYKAV